MEIKHSLVKNNFKIYFNINLGLYVIEVFFKTKVKPHINEVNIPVYINGKY